MDKSKKTARRSERRLPMAPGKGAKGLEETLHDSAQVLKALVQASPLAIIALDPGGNVQMWNPAAERIFGWGEQEVAGRPNPIIPADNQAAFHALHARALHGESLSGVEVRPCKKDGAPIDVSFSTAALRDAEANIIGTMAVIADISERKRMEETLKQSFDMLQRTLEGTVNVLVAAMEKRDPYTAGHQQRVAQLACAIAGEMGLSEDQISGIRMAATLHDLGKISVPAEILSKPGRMDEIEFSIIKTHPRVGYEIIKGVEFPYPVARIILQHHERLNGSGYPDGLSDGDILMEARILSVADAVEATASHRPYRPAQGLDRSLEEITRQRGILYDAEVVDACLRLFKERKFTFR